MEFVFFIYGLAFFILGFAILLYPKRGSVFELAKHLHLIAGFGILHGINEWLDLFILIDKSGNTVTLEIIRAITLPLSFLFLIHFGVKALAIQKRNKKYWFDLITPFAFLLWAVIFFAGERSFLMWDIWSRYLLCFPGTVLTAYALSLQLPELKRTKHSEVILNLRIGFATFFIYGILAGLFVKQADFFPASVFNYVTFKTSIGAPIQIFRSICAIVLAISLTRVLSIFYWETRETLRKSDLRFHTIAMESPVILFVADKEQRLSFIEGKALETIDFNANDAVGKHISEVFPETNGLRELCQKAVGGEDCVSTVVIKETTFEACCSGMRDRDGDIAGVIGVLVDITQRTKAMAELDAFRKEMNENKQMAALGAVSEKMADELSEPLAVSKVFLLKAIGELKTMLGSEHIKKNLKNCLEKISGSVAIIDKFYEAAQISPKPKAEPIDLGQTIRKIVAVFDESARRAHLQVITTGTDIVPCVHISSRELEQVFFIMIQNAIENADGQDAYSLTISCDIENEQMCLHFSDTCGGTEKIENVFDPFLGVSGNGKGSGLGLAIVKRIISAYNGQVRAENNEGTGISFYITLPIEHVYEA